VIRMTFGRGCDLADGAGFRGCGFAAPVAVESNVTAISEASNDRKNRER